jgi:hypothetical protein
MSFCSLPAIAIGLSAVMPGLVPGIPLSGALPS